MASFTVESKNITQLVRLFKKAPEITERWAQKAVNASVQEVLKHATQTNLPWKTGRLTRSFGEGIEIGRLYGSIGPTVEYAMKVHEHSSKPNFMPRLAELAQPNVVQYFEDALGEIAEELASA